MKKLYLLFIFLITIFGCDRKLYYWEFEQSYKEVRQIKIIEIIDGSDYIEKKQISLDFTQEIYYDITNIAMKRYGTNLSHPMGNCFVIEFNNGEYDIISQKEPKHFRYDDDEIKGYNSWLYFEKDDFTLICAKTVISIAGKIRIK